MWDEINNLANTRRRLYDQEVTPIDEALAQNASDLSDAHSALAVPQEDAHVAPAADSRVAGDGAGRSLGQSLGDSIARLDPQAVHAVAEHFAVSHPEEAHAVFQHISDRVAAQKAADVPAKMMDAGSDAAVASLAPSEADKLDLAVHNLAQGKDVNAASDIDASQLQKKVLQAPESHAGSAEGAALEKAAVNSTEEESAPRSVPAQARASVSSGAEPIRSGRESGEPSYRSAADSPVKAPVRQSAPVHHHQQQVASPPVSSEETPQEMHDRLYRERVTYSKPGDYAEHQRNPAFGLGSHPYKDQNGVVHRDAGAASDRSAQLATDLIGVGTGGASTRATREVLGPALGEARAGLNSLADRYAPKLTKDIPNPLNAVKGLFSHAKSPSSAPPAEFEGPMPPAASEAPAAGNKSLVPAKTKDAGIAAAKKTSSKVIKANTETYPPAQQSSSPVITSVREVQKTPSLSGSGQKALPSGSSRKALPAPATRASVTPSVSSGTSMWTDAEKAAFKKQHGYDMPSIEPDVSSFSKKVRKK